MQRNTKMRAVIHYIVKDWLHYDQVLGSEHYGGSSLRSVWFFRDNTLECARKLTNGT